MFGPAPAAECTLFAHRSSRIAAGSVRYGTPMRSSPQCCRVGDVIVVGVCAFVILLAASVDAHQIVFSRRVYAARGHTYQQLWAWSVTGGTFEQLTNSARDHYNAVCSADGRFLFLTRLRPVNSAGDSIVPRESGGNSVDRQMRPQLAATEWTVACAGAMRGRCHALPMACDPLVRQTGRIS
jgi:hypothetical protein